MLTPMAIPFLAEMESDAAAVVAVAGVVETAVAVGEEIGKSCDKFIFF